MTDNTDGIYDENWFAEHLLTNSGKEPLYSHDVVLEVKPENPWKVMAGRKELKQFKCKFCGATSFQVATGICYTAIRCTNDCGYEVCIHEG